MFKFIKRLKDNQSLRDQQLFYSTMLLAKLYEVSESIPDIAELAKNLKGMNKTQVQKELLGKIVEFVKKNEDVGK